MPIKFIQGDTDRHRKIHYEYDTSSKPIGEGGMGVVYRGIKIDEQTGVKTEVAIKVLHDDLPDEVYARAEREASIQIRHTNLVEMYGLISEFEVDRFGSKRTRHYLISELLHGVDLSDLLNGHFDNQDGSENPFAKNLYSRYIKDRKEASIEIIRNISSGVLALHDAGYIHRDIDPSNIMVTTDGCIKLIDFGIAKNINTLSTRDRLTTTAGKFIGKAEYASPELVLGDVKNHNFTTDIYALGILLYRLLAGKLPFNGTQYEVLQKQLKSKIPLRVIEDAGLAKVIKKATEKSQSSRYSSVAEFRVAIDAAAKVNRKRLPVWSYAAVGLLAIALGCSLVWYIYPSSPDIVVADTPRSKFNKALALLDSDNANSVKKGFEQMEELAIAGYDSAKVELGVTYYPYLTCDNKTDSLANPILKRRLYLNLTSQTDVDSVIKYLNQPSVLPPEASFMLGVAYCQKKEGEKNALTMFHQAKYSLDKSATAGHGYDADSLKEILIKNINILQEPE